MPSYCYHPHHSSERCTNKNTHCLIRQYLPKGADLGWLSQKDCTRFAEILKNSPRKHLEYRTPYEVYYDPLKLETIIFEFA